MGSYHTFKIFFFSSDYPYGTIHWNRCKPTVFKFFPFLEQKRNNNFRKQQVCGASQKRRPSKRGLLYSCIRMPAFHFRPCFRSQIKSKVVVGCEEELASEFTLSKFRRDILTSPVTQAQAQPMHNFGQAENREIFITHPTPQSFS